MADLETRVDKLEEKVAELEKDINDSLGDIKTDLVEIKGCLQGNSSVSELKIESNSKRIEKLENNQSKLVWAIIFEVLGLIGASVIFYIKSGA